MVMVHGMFCGGPIFAQMISQLRGHFAITTIDILGMGASGRPDFDACTPESAKRWFLDSIERWVEVSGFG